MYAIVAILVACVIWSLVSVLRSILGRQLYRPPLDLAECIAVPIRVNDVHMETELIRHIQSRSARPNRLVFVLPRGNSDLRVSQIRQASIPYECVRFVGRHARLVKEFVDDEKFVLLVSPGVTLEYGWDERLLECLDDNKDTVVTCVPSANYAATFPALSRFAHNKFTIRGLPVSTRIGKTTPSLFWCPHFSFSRSDVVSTVQPHTPATFCTDNVRLWTQGIHFIAPTSVIATRHTSSWFVASTKKLKPIDKSVDTDGLRTFLTYIGIHPGSNRAHPRSYCGLTPQSTDVERIVKFGSVGRAASALHACVRFSDDKLPLELPNELSHGA